MRRRPRAFGAFAGIAVVTAAAAPWASSAPHTYETWVNPGTGIEFVYPSTVFALAGEPINSLDRGLAAPAGLTIAWPSPSVLVSRDGGRTWRVSLSTSAGFWGLAFADPQHGLALGVQALYRTADGGRSWRRSPVPAQPLVRAAFIGGYTAAGLTISGRLVFTRDAGLAWHDANWPGHGRAVCRAGLETLVADQNGAVWRSKDPGYPFAKVLAGRTPPVKDGPWWVDLSCANQNAVEFMESFPEAAGAAVETILRQSTNGGITWRQLALISNGAGDETAPVPARAVAVGDGTACLFSYPSTPTLDIRCTSDGGRSFRHAPAPRLPDGHLQGVDFLGPKSGWLEVVGSFVTGRRPPRYQTQVWRTDDGGSWRVAYGSPLRRVPQLP